MINRGVIPILGDADRLLSLVHVKDLVAGIYTAAVSECAIGETYFLTDGDIHTWRGIERVIADALEKRPFKVKVPFFLLDFISIFTEAAAKITRQTPTLNRQKVRDLKQRFWICDSTKAREELGYRPTYFLEKGMQETADWYRALVQWLALNLIVHWFISSVVHWCPTYKGHIKRKCKTLRETEFL